MSRRTPGTNSTAIHPPRCRRISVAYSTFLWGNLSDQARAIALRGTTDAYVAGTTESTDFPVVSPYQVSQVGVNDVFVSRITDATPPHEQSRSITYTYDPLRAALRAARGATG